MKTNNLAAYIREILDDHIKDCDSDDRTIDGPDADSFFYCDTDGQVIALVTITPLDVREPQ